MLILKLQFWRTVKRLVLIRSEKKSKKICDGYRWISLWESEKKLRMFTHINWFNQHVFPSTKEE